MAISLLLMDSWSSRQDVAVITLSEHQCLDEMLKVSPRSIFPCIKRQRHKSVGGWSNETPSRMLSWKGRDEGM